MLESNQKRNRSASETFIHESVSDSLFNFNSLETICVCQSMVRSKGRKEDGVTAMQASVCFDQRHASHLHWSLLHKVVSLVRMPVY